MAVRNARPPTPQDTMPPASPPGPGPPASPVRGTGPLWLVGETPGEADDVANDVGASDGGVVGGEVGGEVGGVVGGVMVRALVTVHVITVWTSAAVTVNEPSASGVTPLSHDSVVS